MEREERWRPRPGRHVLAPPTARRAPGQAHLRSCWDPSSSWPPPGASATLGSPSRLLEDRDAGQLFALEVLEGRTAAGRNMGEAPRQPKALDGRDRVAAADQCVAARARDGLADRLGPIAEIGNLEYSHGPVPHHGAGAMQSLGEQ